MYYPHQGSTKSNRIGINPRASNNKILQLRRGKKGRKTERRGMNDTSQSQEAKKLKTQKPPKSTVIALSYAGAYEIAVMIKGGHALITNATVMRT